MLLAPNSACGTTVYGIGATRYGCGGGGWVLSCTPPWTCTPSVPTWTETPPSTCTPVLGGGGGGGGASAGAPGCAAASCGSTASAHRTPAVASVAIKRRRVTSIADAHTTSTQIKKIWPLDMPT